MKIKDKRNIKDNAPGMIFLSIRSSLSGLFFSLLASTINESNQNKKKFLDNEMKDRIIEAIIGGVL